MAPIIATADARMNAEEERRMPVAHAAPAPANLNPILIGAARPPIVCHARPDGHPHVVKVLLAANWRLLVAAWTDLRKRAQLLAASRARRLETVVIECRIIVVREYFRAACWRRAHHHEEGDERCRH